MTIFVVNAYEDRKEKYLNDDRYELYPAIWWENVSDEDVEKYYFRHNANMDYRRKVVACSESHKSILMKIIKEDLKDTFILEDDAIIEDWDKLDELKGFQDFCYIGGL